MYGLSPPTAEKLCINSSHFFIFGMALSIISNLYFIGFSLNISIAISFIGLSDKSRKIYNN